MKDFDQTLATAGLGAAAAGPLAVAALHVMPETGHINPVRRTLSEYALHDTAWLFNLGVLTLAAGSVAVLITLTRTGVVRPFSIGGLGLALWSIGLAAVVYFPKHNWSIGPSASGHIHRGASLVAFIALPLAALAIVLATRRIAHWRHHRRWTALFAVGSLLLLGVIVVAFLLQPITGILWWRAIPLGAVERSMAAAEVATILALGWWARAAARVTPRGSSDHQMSW